MTQTERIIEKAKQLGINVGSYSNSIDGAMKVADEIGYNNNGMTYQWDEIENILDEKLASTSPEILETEDNENMEEQSQSDYGVQKGTYSANRNKEDDTPESRAEKKKELDEKVKNAKEERGRKNKTIEKVGKNGETTLTTKAKNGLDRFKDNLNVARAKKERFQNNIGNAKSKLNNVLHPGQAIKNKVKASAKNGLKKIGKQFVNLGKRLVKSIAKFIASNPIIGIILLVCGLLFLIILIYMLVLSNEAGGQGGKNPNLFELLGYYDKECNFNESVVKYSGCFNPNEDTEISLDEFIIGSTYYYTKDTYLNDDQLMAAMIILKTNALSIGLYNNNEKTLKVSGCTMGYESSIPKSNYSKIEKVYKTIKEKIYLAENYTGTIQSLNLFDSLSFDVDKIKKQSGGYEIILDNLYKDSDLKIYDIKDNCTYYNPTENNNFWWPIGGSTSNNGIYDGSPTVTYVSSGYGMRVIQGVESFHSGIDIANNQCEKHVIIAAKSGTVTKASDGCDSVGYYGNKCGGGYGNWVMIDHGDGTSSVYAHMTKDSLVVSEGDKVVQGQKIGAMGSSGSSTGCHLHFEVRVNNTRVNPADYISSSNPRPRNTIALTNVNDKTTSASENKVEICKALLLSGYSENSVAGMMVNIQAEGSFLTNNLEGCYEENKCCKVNGRDYGFCVHPEIKGFGSDNLYTQGVDSGAYPRDKFINDRAGYGLIQWTSSGRKAGLYDYAKNNKKSIAALSVQLGYLLEEVKSYPYTYKYITGNYSTYDIANNFCLDFERPANKESNCPARANNYSAGMLQFVKNGCSN